MNTVLSLLLMALLSEDPDSNNCNIAKYLFFHINEAEHLSLQSLADACFVSKAAVIKFIKHLGFSSYSQFKSHFSLTLKSRKIQLEKKFEGVDDVEVLDKIYCISNNDISLENLREKAEALAELLISKKRMNLYGAVFPLNLSLSFIEDMAMAGIHIMPYELKVNEEFPDKSKDFNCLITLSGRWIESDRFGFEKILHSNSVSAVISTKDYVSNMASLPIVLPTASNADLEHVILLLFWELVLLCVLKRLKK